MTTLELGGITLGLRHGLIGLIVLVAAYILFVLLRMVHLRKPPVVVPEPRPEAFSVAGDTAESAVSQPSPQVEFDPMTRRDLAPDAVDSQALRSGVEQELAQLRDEVDAIRGELAALRADMQQGLASLRASQTVSPIYGDAMQLAVSGYDAAAIAERCGIARAEADLVVALAKSQER